MKKIQRGARKNADKGPREKRSSGNFKKSQVHSSKLTDYRYDDKPSTIMSTSTKQESPADRELRRLVSADVFRSNPKTVKQSNSNPRRYK